MSDLVIDSSNYRKAILAALLVVVWLIPGIVLALDGYANPHALLDFSAVQLGINEGSGIETGSGAGYEVVLMAIVQIAGMGASSLLYLPIGSLLVPLVYYYVARRFSSARYAALASVFIAYMVPLVTVQFSLLIFTSVSVIALVFMLALWKYLHSREIGLAIAIIALFVASLFVHRALAAWLVIALIVAGVGGRYWMQRDVKMTPMLGIAAFSILLYLAFEFNFYERFLPAIASQGLADPSGDLQFVLGNFFLVGADYQMDPLRQSDPSGALVGVITILVFFTLLLPIAIALALIGKRLKATGGIPGIATKSLLLIIVFSIFIGNLIVEFIYRGVGFDVLPVLIFFPIVLPFACSMIHRIPSPDIGKGSVSLALTILIAAMIGLAALQSDLQTSTLDDQVQSVADFWQERGDNNETMTADLESFGLFSLSLADAGASPPRLLPMNSSGYRYLIGAGNATDRPAECFFFTDSDFTSPILGMDWRYYRPIAKLRLLALEGNPNLDCTYDDGMGVLLSRI